MGLKVDPIGVNNVSFMRLARPSVSSIQRTRRCLFGPSDPEESKRIYENCANNERNRCIERYGFDPVKTEYVVNDTTADNATTTVENEGNVESNTVDNQNEMVMNNDNNKNVAVPCAVNNVVVSDNVEEDRESNESTSTSDEIDAKDNHCSNVNDGMDVIKYKLRVKDEVLETRTQLIKRPHEHQKTGKHFQFKFH